MILTWIVQHVTASESRRSAGTVIASAGIPGGSDEDFARVRGARACGRPCRPGVRAVAAVPDARRAAAARRQAEPRGARAADRRRQARPLWHLGARGHEVHSQPRRGSEARGRVDASVGGGPLQGAPDRSALERGTGRELPAAGRAEDQRGARAVADRPDARHDDHPLRSVRAMAPDLHRRAPDAEGSQPHVAGLLDRQMGR